MPCRSQLGGAQQRAGFDHAIQGRWRFRHPPPRNAFGQHSGCKKRSRPSASVRRLRMYFRVSGSRFSRLREDHARLQPEALGGVLHVGEFDPDCRTVRLLQAFDNRTKRTGVKADQTPAVNTRSRRRSTVQNALSPTSRGARCGGEGVCWRSSVRVLGRP